MKPAISSLAPGKHPSSAGGGTEKSRKLVRWSSSHNTSSGIITNTLQSIPSSAGWEKSVRENRSACILKLRRRLLDGLLLDRARSAARPRRALPFSASLNPAFWRPNPANAPRPPAGQGVWRRNVGAGECVQYFAAGDAQVRSGKSSDAWEGKSEAPDTELAFVGFAWNPC